MNNNGSLILLAISLIMISCNPKKDADLIVTNAKVYTLDDDFSIVNCFAVKDGHFIAIGDSTEILDQYQSTEVLDVGGKTVYPGFIDGHCHFWGYSMGLRKYSDLKGTASFHEIIEILKKYHAAYPQRWILGRGWDQNDWAIKAFPDNRIIDQLFPETPVVLVRIDGHAVLANSEALKLAGINENTKIEGGKVVRENGRLTGILIDNATDIMMKAIPGMKDEDIKVVLAEAQQNCFAVGLTSLEDAGLNYHDILTIDSLQKAGTLKIRINAMINPSAENFKEFLNKGKYQTAHLTVTSVKLYADGALGSRGALLLKPYSDDSGNYGLSVSSKEYFRDVLRKIFDGGYQANTHCIGDSAVRMILDLYGEVLQGTNDRRWRIEHAQIVDPMDLNKFKKYSVIPSIQSTHCTSDMSWAADRLGPERIRHAYIAKQLLEQNGWLVNGTDFPVEEINPIYSFYAAVARKDLKGNPPDGFQMENALSRQDALRSITIWPAKGSFEEKMKGSIDPGKYADFVILDGDLMTTKENKLPSLAVISTFIAGEKVFDKK